MHLEKLQEQHPPVCLQCDSQSNAAVNLIIHSLLWCGVHLC